MFRLAHRLLLSPQGVSRVAVQATSSGAGTIVVRSISCAVANTASAHTSSINSHSAHNKVLPSHRPNRTIVRTFAKKHKNKGGGGGGGGGGGTKTLKVYNHWSNDPEDVDETIEADVFDKIKVSKGNALKELKSSVESLYGEDDGDVQIYNSQTKAFELLEDLDQVKREDKKQGRVVLAPSSSFLDDEGYDDEDYDDEDYDDEEDYSGMIDDDDDINNDPYDELSMINNRETLGVLVEKLKEQGWELAGDEQLTQKTSSTTQPTKEVILQLAQDDRDLQNYLVREVGGLHHLVTCVHFDFVWNPPSVHVDDDDSEDDEDAEEAEFNEKD